jgi:hypothetical protein
MSESQLQTRHFRQVRERFQVQRFQGQAPRYARVRALAVVVAHKAEAYKAVT